jgi:hypothetical protein
MPRAVFLLGLLLLAAQPAWPQTLAPGKPAGTKAAQHISQRTLFIGGSLVAIALAFGLPSSSPASTSTSTATSTATTG